MPRQVIFFYTALLTIVFSHYLSMLNNISTVSIQIWPQIIQSLVFFFSSSLFDTVVSLPLSLYKVFVIEERHGFNKQTIGLFFMDMIKSHLIGLLIGSPILAAFIFLVQWGMFKCRFYWLVFNLNSQADKNTKMFTCVCFRRRVLLYLRLGVFVCGAVSHGSYLSNFDSTVF